MSNKWYEVRDYKLLKKGDKISLSYDGEKRVGVLLKKPEFFSTNTYGGYFAKVKWEDGQIDTDVQINKTSLRVNRRLK